MMNWTSHQVSMCSCDFVCLSRASPAASWEHSGIRTLGHKGYTDRLHLSVFASTAVVTNPQRTVTRPRSPSFYGVLWNLSPCFYGLSPQHNFPVWCQSHALNNLVSSSSMQLQKSLRNPQYTICPAPSKQVSGWEQLQPRLVHVLSITASLCWYCSYVWGQPPICLEQALGYMLDL